MQADNKVRFFLGSNSSQGFYSLYDQLIDPKQANAIYILKGGPGCGKSTLMRRVAARAEEMGEQVEYIHCSGDPDSLDGIVLPSVKTAIVDGTAPHVVEPKYPGLVDHYVNLGSCYKQAELQHIRREIMDCMAGYKECYTQAYRCLNAAGQISEDALTVLETNTLQERISNRAHSILSREIRTQGSGNGQVTQRFLGAITHCGQLTCFATASALCKRIYLLEDSYGLSHLMLPHLLAGATHAGFDVIVCPSPLMPDRLEHLIVPELSLAFLSTPAGSFCHKRPYRRIRMDSMVDSELLRRSKARLRFSRKITTALIDEAVESLTRAKNMHDHLETLYNPHVDFEQVNHIADELSKSILIH